MKAVVGVNSGTGSRFAVDLFAKLKFSDSQAVLVYVVEPVLPDGGFMPETSLSPIVDIQRQRQIDGERMLDEYSRGCQVQGIACTTQIEFGNAAHMLTQLAKDLDADLLVAGSGRKGALESFIMGSVTRALVSEARRSILIGKGAVGEGGALNILVATDHSDYANKCFGKLLTFAPTGIGRLTIVTADTLDPGIREVVDNAEGITRGEVLARKNEALRKSLLPICPTIECHVIAGRANDAIDEAMKVSRADLLVIGAQGHGFLERMVMGSTAMHMVANSPWNVLVLRV